MIHMRSLTIFFRIVPYLLHKMLVSSLSRNFIKLRPKVNIKMRFPVVSLNELDKMYQKLLVDLYDTNGTMAAIKRETNIKLRCLPFRYFFARK